MSNQKRFNVAVVGATGAVGEQIIRLLAEREFPVNELKLLSSARSAGTKIQFKDREVTIEEATPESFKGIDIALFSAGGDVSRKLVPHAIEDGAVCIDNTSAFRMDPETPLVVPEVNIDKISEHKGVIANPNCSTIQMVAALKPLYDRYGISRIIVSTYQAVSGAGAKAIQEMLRQSKEVLDGRDASPDILPVSSLPVKHQIAFNAIPQIDKFTENGFTYEEMKMINETKKIMDDESLEVTATCVRIPVVYGHSESVYVELKQDFDLEEAKSLIAEAPGIELVDNPDEQQYPLATDATGKLETFVGRVRRDLSNPRALNMWIVSDNLLKGAAWNAVQIAEYIAIEQK
ncbi:aspartate-semialdehyde dehydrogenase [Paenibacillus hemerocallicola]|uniref:Aspartate-semialdehyde dehydrogenase n=1 Tax=Paenibacillus hemerocallicola TaxID=1172614 RepID=A0A5C4TAS5_9BACL|nr:aspartate-semialdehyde dehydrogenase [Paenibacillus hemerocallicola]TNJ66163.1 aspartate-semialdehyde dehydrogenase [Paenibacillus hemerocallicola]